VLNYAVTSNHIHLLVRDYGERDVIPDSMQLIAGRMGQEYNLRKHRKGAFREDRYHATAVEADTHLIQCMVYMDMNMVRTGVMKHPSEWPHGGYHEIQDPPKRYAIMDLEGLQELLRFRSREDLAAAYRGWIEAAVNKRAYNSEAKWTESIAVGIDLFVIATKEKLGIKGKAREVVGSDGSYELRESSVPYRDMSGHDNDVLRLQNEVRGFIEEHRLMGKGLGYIDAHLLASSLLSHVVLWTLDKRLGAKARSLGIRHAGTTGR
jgi:hypothetical protein